MSITTVNLQSCTWHEDARARQVCAEIDAVVEMVQETTSCFAVHLEGAKTGA